MIFMTFKSWPQQKEESLALIVFCFFAEQFMRVNKFDKH